jgi:uncharacterized protein YjhX (UPF0386 family)
MKKRPSLMQVLHEIARGDVLVSPYPEAVIDELRRRMLIRTPFGKDYEVTELGYAALKAAGLEIQDNAS